MVIIIIMTVVCITANMVVLKMYIHVI